MLNILSLKKKQQESKKKTNAFTFRVQKDISEMDLAKQMKLSIINKDLLNEFVLQIKPDDGYYLGGTFTFTITIPVEYPHEPPLVKCNEIIYHPNIDVQGNVCLNILRQDWKPVLNLHAVFVGLFYLFLEPNALDPLNKEDALVLRTNKGLFRTNVQSNMNGGVLDSVSFTKVI